MGFIEVLLNIRTINKNIQQVKADIENYRPDALILIDYPGFNLRMAEFAHGLNIKVYYYISPKVWAWKANRIKKIKAWVRQLYLILPFEEDFYAKHDYYRAKYVGNPLLDEISNFNKAKKQAIASEKPIVALLPGSRKMEVKKILPVMLKAARSFTDFDVMIAGVSSLPKELYDGINPEKHPIVLDNTYQLLSQSHTALVTSGTATLETALFNVPQVVCYKAHPLTIWIAKRLVNIKFISLVNLIMDKEVVKELIQDQLNEQQLVKEFQIISEGIGREKMLAQYQILHQKMGEPGASKRVAINLVSDVKA